MLSKFLRGERQDVEKFLLFVRNADDEAVQGVARLASHAEADQHFIDLMRKTGGLDDAQLSRLYREAKDYSATQSRAFLATVADERLNQANLSRLLDTFDTAAGREALEPYSSMKELLADIGEMCSRSGDGTWKLLEGLGGIDDSLMHRLTLEGSGGSLDTIRGAVGPLVAARRATGGDWSRVVAFSRKPGGVDCDLLYFDPRRGADLVQAEVKHIAAVPEDDRRLASWTEEFGGHILRNEQTSFRNYELWFTRQSNLQPFERDRVWRFLDAAFDSVEVKAGIPNDTVRDRLRQTFKDMFNQLLRFGVP
jgi:hypothetical protein